MRTTAAFFAVLGVCCLTLSGAAYAADPGVDAVAPAPGIPVSSAPMPVLSSPSSGESLEKSVSTMEDKVSENAKSVVRHLDVASEETTFADLNRARQTVTRIEAMIDVEKHLNELEKLRNERHDTHVPSVTLPLANAIPASALAMPSSVPFISTPTEMPKVHHIVSESRPTGSHPEISRISGAGGKYTAVLKLSGGDVKSVMVGDRLADGDVVRAITASSVEIGGKEASYTLRVKNVDVVYSAMR
jgi:type IV pilus biogenesis protein PilP